MAVDVAAEIEFSKNDHRSCWVKLYRKRLYSLKDLPQLRRKSFRGSMDLIAIFPRVRHMKHCLLSEDSCLEPARAPESRGTTESVAQRCSTSQSENELLKQYDAAWRAGFQAESNASKVSSYPKVCQHKRTIRSSSRKDRRKPLPEPVAGEIKRRHVKELESTAKTEERHIVARRVDKSRRNIRLATLYLPSLTLWVLSFVAAVIWLGVFFVERQPVQDGGVQGVGAVRVAETPRSSYEEEKSRQ